jgi:Lipocalin-like domain
LEIWKFGYESRTSENLGKNSEFDCSSGSYPHQFMDSFSRLITFTFFYRLIMQYLPGIIVVVNIKPVFMRKIYFAASVIALFGVINACKKSTTTNNARTMQSLSGSYTITSLTADIVGQSVNLYDSLPPCERDNVIQLNSTGTAAFIDAGVVCVPPSDSTGTWSLSQNTDTIYVAGGASFIKSWDGTTLVLANQETISGIPFPVTATTTLLKK